MVLLNNNVVIGIMSGTSLDGIDICACLFEKKDGTIKYKIIAAETIPFTSEWKKQLSDAHNLSGVQLTKLNNDFGSLIGNVTINFIDKYKLKPALISSHGHTVFHQPDEGFTLQIGAGSHIAAITGINTICDFRSIDVALGGQGAPLVPIGDKLLFGEYEACLNLGGIANISFNDKNKRLAFDICPVNMALNYFAGKLNHEYDDRGKIASEGKVDEALLISLNTLSFYNQKGPKSLGKEWFEEVFLPTIESYALSKNLSIEDIMRTIVEHIAMQHQIVFEMHKIKGPVLITGGGAFNDFLISRINSLSVVETHIPDTSVINFKEALIFALLGWLNSINENNTLSSATGSRKDSIGGALYRGN